MSLLERIKNDRLTYRKSGQRNEAAALTTLVGELETMEKRGDKADNAVVIGRIKKTIDGLIEIIDLQGSNEAASAEIQLLDSYLPKQLTEAEMEVIVVDSGATNIGEAMKYLKENYAGCYDGRIAKKVILGVL